MRKPPLLFSFIVLLIALIAGPAAAAQSAGDDDGVLVRINGDLVVEPGADHGLVLVIDGNLTFDGEATVIVVINGDAVLTGATVDELVVVSGTLELGAGTVVTGDVNLVDTPLTQDATATVEGSIDLDAGDRLASGFWLLGMVFMLGWAVLAVLGALLFAGIAPGLARGAGRTITDDLGPSVVAGLLLWVVAPILGVMLFATVIGIPTALTIWVVALPLLGFVGFLAAGVRIGDQIVARGEGRGHPYLASFVGVLALIIVGAIPVLGALVVAVATFLGSGAVALHAFRAFQSDPEAEPPTTAIPFDTPQPAPPEATSATP